MTDRDIIQGLIDHDEHVTHEFFFVQCRPLLSSIIHKVFDARADYGELVSELYLFLMADDAARLRRFEYRSTVYQWLKVLAVRFFIKKRRHMIETEAQETPYDREPQVAMQPLDARADLERLLMLMPNKRYVDVIRRLVIEEVEPERLAMEMHVTTANLYNIKRRAIAALTRVALTDIQEYGRSSHL